MEQKTNIGNAFLSYSAVKVYGFLALIFLTIPAVVVIIGLTSEKVNIKFVLQLSSAFLPIYFGYALRFYMVRNVSRIKEKLISAVTPDEAFKVIFGGFLWGFPVVVLATACYIYTKITIW